MAVSSPGVTKIGSLLLGLCLPCLRHNASKIEVQYYQIDTYLLKYFKETFTVFALDPKKICKTGDIVLIEELPKKFSTSINHRVLKVVYPCGDITDPVTNEKVVGSLYRSEMELHESVYGKIPNRFDYHKAPPRGWQEGKKDFSHRQTFIKYHEFGSDDENKDNPFAKNY